MEKTYNKDEMAMIAKDAANLSAAATIDPARWCKREEGEGVGDWTSRARSIAIHEFIRMRLLADVA